jgi:hypothetical protein
MRFYSVGSTEENVHNLNYSLRKNILEYFICPKEENNSTKSKCDEIKMINDVLLFLQNLKEEFLFTFLVLTIHFERI